MIRYEYKVIPAPAKGLKAPGVKGAEARFAHALEQRMNEFAADGWEYLRADILPSEERQGLTSTQTVYRSVLVFRREIAPEMEADPAAEADEGAADTSAVEEPAEDDAPDTAEPEEDTVAEEAGDNAPDKKDATS
ncbi:MULTISPECIES: DUF4177 domain-containing protein [unclassified Roseovarius]|uniref:DUF4177 domain-containing protein n=1 Tax=unclassified Roseovarius TaxID=2614913 RepID=UPI00273D37AD|nr:MULTISPECIES: DUF4177 domain-containing protein [unclassified Roseovarius]